MSSIISFFKWLWNGLVNFFTWFVGLPALIVASITGLYSSLSQVFGAFSSGDDLASSWFSTFDSNVSALVNVVNSAPDIIKVAMYALSMDTLFTYVTSVFAIFLTLIIALLTFFCVAIPSFVIEIYAVKLTAWFINAMFPRGFSIAGISALANLNIVKPIREAMKDGKYNPWLGG